MMELKEYTPGGVHEKVLDRLASLPKGTVLDVPSGQGALSRSLEAVGFKVFSGDIEIKNILYRNGRCVRLNLNHFLPFKNMRFDYVVCTEGIEHIENPHHLIREFGRLVRKGGYLIITTPNVMTIKSRLRFLFYSYLDFFRYFGPLPAGARYTIKEHEHQHLNPVLFTELKFIFKKYGFAIERVETNRMVRRWNIIFPLIKWIIKYKTRKKFPKDPLFVSDVILEGEDLIVIAKHELETFLQW
jgi:SAM-dependent methyltransferase